MAGITSPDLEHVFGQPAEVGTWHDPEAGRQIAAPLERCAELLSVDLPRPRAGRRRRTVHSRGRHEVWSLMLLERQHRPEHFGRRRGGYLDRPRRTAGTNAPGASRDTLGGHCDLRRREGSGGC